MATLPQRSTLLRWLGALLVIYAVLLLPDRPEALGFHLIGLLPLELPVIVLALVAFTGRTRDALRILIVVLLTLMLIYKLGTIGTRFGFDRPFNPLVDAFMVPVALDTISKGVGFLGAAAAVFGVVLVVGLVVALLYWATGVIAQRVTAEARIFVSGAAFLIAMLSFVPALKGKVHWDSSVFMRDQAVRFVRNLEDSARFRAALLEKPFADLPADGRLASLKNTDVLFIFVESYGRSSLDNPRYSDIVRPRLKSFGAEMEAKGFTAKSAWMLSPTYGGESYLAHSTVVSGLLVENNQRYSQLLRSQHETLVGDFTKAGWRSVTIMPEITMPWPEVDFFGFDAVYSAPNLEFKGQSFDYMTMSDQYVMAELQRRELSPFDRKPVMALIGLISSHIPWAPLPKFVPWDAVGDGTIFNTARTMESADEVWNDQKTIDAAYAQSIAYSLETLQSFVSTYAKDNTLVLIIGDHQPMSFIAGEGASHEVPAHLIARNPDLIAPLDQGTWTPGMEPGADSPSWSMDSLRERILKAYTPAS